MKYIKEFAPKLWGLVEELIAESEALELYVNKTNSSVKQSYQQLYHAYI